MPCSKSLLLIFICLSISCNDVDLIDDYVPPVLRITTPFTEITLGNSYDFEASYFNNIGELIPNSQLEWESSNSEILTINSNGNAIPLKAGEVKIRVKITTTEGEILQDEISITIQSNVVLTAPEEPVEEETEEEVEEELEFLCNSYLWYSLWKKCCRCRWKLPNRGRRIQSINTSKYRKKLYSW